MPTLANQLGIPAETPVLISSYFTYEMRCHVCDVRCTPLAYQTGYEYKRQHIHEKDGIYYYSGIYHYSGRKPLLPERTVGSEGFVAVIEPIGPTSRDGIEKQSTDPLEIVERSISEKIYVKEIKAFCVGCAVSEEYVPNSQLMELQEGFIVPYRIRSEGRVYARNYSVPVCDPQKHPDLHPFLEGAARYRFSINKVGEVHFSHQIRS